MIAPELHAQIRRLFYAEHWRLNTIAAQLGVHHDTIRRAIGQLEADSFVPDFIGLNPNDWTEIELIKDSQDRYIAGNPKATTGLNLWNRLVYTSPAITEGSFVAASLAQSTVFYSREDANLLLSPSDGDNFVKNLITALAGGGYEQGPLPAAAAVPEPQSVTLVVFALLVITARFRLRHSMVLLAVFGVLFSNASNSYADIFRWDNGAVIPGTEDIEPGPSGPFVARVRRSEPKGSD